jgi:hypothetical protein
MPSAVKKARASLAGKATPSKAVVEEEEDAEKEVDERFATAKSMAARDEEEEEEEEDGSDGGESGGEEEDGGLAKFVGREKGQDKLWADPTHAEMKGLKEAELHFKSSLLRLQMDELKSQVSGESTPVVDGRGVVYR